MREAITITLLSKPRQTPPLPSEERSILYKVVVEHHIFPDTSARGANITCRGIFLCKGKTYMWLPFSNTVPVTGYARYFTPTNRCLQHEGSETLGAVSFVSVYFAVDD